MERYYAQKNYFPFCPGTSYGINNKCICKSESLLCLWGKELQVGIAEIYFDGRYQYFAPL